MVHPPAWCWSTLASTTPKRNVIDSSVWHLWRHCSIGHPTKCSANIVVALELRHPTASCAKWRYSPTLAIGRCGFPLRFRTANAKCLGIGDLVVHPPSWQRTPWAYSFTTSFCSLSSDLDASNWTFLPSHSLFMFLFHPIHDSLILFWY